MRRGYAFFAIGPVLPGSVYSVPALTIGWAPSSPHSTTSRLLTICALRSSSSSTTPFFCSSASAISTMPTAPATIRVRAAMIALGLLPLQHRLGDFRRVGEVADARVDDVDAGVGQALVDLVPAGAGDFGGWLRRAIWPSSCWS